MAHLLTDQLRLMAGYVPAEVGYKNLDTGECLTFIDWEELSNRLARGLVAAGVEKGDRVAIHVGPDDVLHWVVGYAAIHKAGAVAVPTNTRLVAAELVEVLDHAGAIAALTSQSLRPVVDAAAGQLDDLRLVADAPWADVAADDGSTFQIDVEDQDIADLMYTSGTTGRAKGVVVRHDNAAMMPNGLPAWTGDGWMHGSPLSTFAGIASVYNPMKLGMRGLFLPKFDAGRWLALVESERPLAVFLVPAMAQLLVGHPDIDRRDLSSVGLCSVGSAPLAPETQRRLQSAFPNAAVSNSYGMTEAGAAYCAMPAEEIGKRIGSVGKPMPPVEFRIVDEADGVSDEPLGAREIGELIVRNAGRQREYYRDPEATAAAWRGEWLYTGDLAYLDEDGFLYIVGRKKDVIIRGGNNVHAADVEAVLYQHPDVLEAAVAGIPHAVLGEDVAAWIVLRPGVATGADELTEFCRQRLSDYKVPRSIVFADALPRNATGKVVKRDLPR